MESLNSQILASSIVLLVLLTIVVVIYFAVSSSKAKKQKKYYEDLHRDLKKGQKVAFGGGLYGEIVRLGTETCDIKVKSGAVIEVSRYAIQEIVK